MTANTTIPVLDRRGKSISTAIVFDVAAELDQMAEGDRLDIITDDFKPIEEDIAAWCRMREHRLIESTATPAGQRYIIEKGTGRRRDTRLAMVISSDGLEELLSPLAFALAAALEGMDVNLYFQGPAVRVLTRNYRPKLKGWARPFSRFAAAGMAKTGHVAAAVKLQQLRSLGAKIYVCGGSMPHFKVSPEDLMFDDLPLVEYLTFMEVMEQADVTLYN